MINSMLAKNKYIYVAAGLVSSLVTACSSILFVITVIFRDFCESTDCEGATTNNDLPWVLGYSALFVLAWTLLVIGMVKRNLLLIAVPIVILGTTILVQTIA